MNHKALEAVEVAVMMTISSEPYRRGRPGVAVSRLPKEMREALKSLTSEDTMKMRLCFPPGGDLPPVVTVYGRRVECDDTMRKAVAKIRRGERKRHHV
jgi:hypothetical protein